MKKNLMKVLGLIFLFSFKSLISFGQDPNGAQATITAVLKPSGTEKFDFNRVVNVKTKIGSDNNSVAGETYSISRNGVTITSAARASTGPLSAVSTLTLNLTYPADAVYTAAGLSAQDIVDMKAANIYAAQQFTSRFIDPINVNITMNVVAGTGTLGGSNTPLFSTGFAGIVSAVVSDASSADDATTTGVGGSVPSGLTDPISGTHNWWLTKAQRKALGLAADDATTDGTYTFGGGFTYTYDPNNRAVAGAYDYIGVTMHEFSEIMGRLGGLGGSINSSPAYLYFDLFHYTGAGARGLNTAAGRSFSIDNGTTLLKAFNTPGSNGSDAQDWASGTNDSFNAFSSSGVLNALSAVDVRNMDVIGYDLSGCTPPTISCPANISVNNTLKQCGANVSYPAATATGVPAPNITYSISSGSFFPVGTTTVTATATNGCGTASSCTFTVRVIDNELPSIICAAQITVKNDLGVCGARVTYTTPVGTDNCGSTTTQTAGLASGSLFPVGTTTNTFVVTDASNNSASCSFDVIVTDNEKPVITTAPVFSCYEAGGLGCSINLGASATDNCAVASFTSDAPVCFPVGTTTVTWTAIDTYGNTTTQTQLVTRNPELNVKICADITRTIYRGKVAGFGPYGPQSIKLNGYATGGTPGYSYKWLPTAGLTNSTIANPLASPVSTTTYTLTVTDSKGCTRSLSITINILPLSADICAGTGNSTRFLVCHIPYGDPSNSQNICIANDALGAHLSQSLGHIGCHLGPCGEQLCYSTIPATKIIPVAAAKVNSPIIAEASDELIVNAYPNPSTANFKIQVISNSGEQVAVRIMDVAGVVKSVNLMNAKNNFIMVGSDLPSGIYVAEIIQGKKRQVIKLIKLK